MATEMTHLERTKNCGIAEISMLSSSGSPLRALQQLAPEFKHGVTWPYVNGERKNFLFPFITFTAVVRKGDGMRPSYGPAFADFIVEHNLGTLTTLPDKSNWTGNTIQIWVWCPDYVAIWKLLDAERTKQEVVDGQSK